jgi:hypothetical protein
LTPQQRRRSLILSIFIDLYLGVFFSIPEMQVMNDPADMRAIAQEAVLAQEAAVLAAEMLAHHKVLESGTYDRLLELLQQSMDGMYRLLTALEEQDRDVPLASICRLHRIEAANDDAGKQTHE